VIDDSHSVTFKLPKIYPVTDTRLSGLSHAEQVARLIDGGATLIQLRDKHGAPRDLLQQAEAALRVARRSNTQIIINDRVDIAMALDAGGVHLGQSDLPAKIARRLLKPGSIVGVSTHNLAQVEIAARLPLDYVAFGPIFDTETKADHDPVVGLDGLRLARRLLGDRPLVAIGGITGENCRDVIRAGADSVALIATLLSDPAKISAIMRRLLASASE
jgi:thiamine-phosphate pyrophosphorylase